MLSSTSTMLLCTLFLLIINVTVYWNISIKYYLMWVSYELESTVQHLDDIKQSPQFK